MIKKYLIKRIYKGKLNNAFRIADLVYKSSFKGKNLYTFPKILDVRIGDHKDTYIFRLPAGVDPALIKKKMYVFYSLFGERIEFKLANNLVTFYVYKNYLNNSFDYNFEELKPVMNKYRFPVVAGRDVNGKLICFDMKVFPHLLIGGTTGSGKSVESTVIIVSWIEYFTQVRKGGLKLYLADLKLGNFHIFRNVNLVQEVITTVKKLKTVVDLLEKELDVRGKLLDKYQVDHIDNLPIKLDYLVLFIDEYEVIKDPKIEESIYQLVARGRALGIFVVACMQRPDAKTMDTRIRALMNVRYCFRVRAKIESVIVLGINDVDSSKIKASELGKFYMVMDEPIFLQSAFLPVDDFVGKDGKIHIGAKTILTGYKSINSDSDILEGEYTIIDDTEESKGSGNDPDEFIPLLD